MHRACTGALWDHGALPFHSGARADVQPDGPPVELVLDLHPTSSVVPVGRRLRVCVAGADRDNLQTLHRRPASRMTVHRGPGTLSRVLLPLAPLDGSPWPGWHRCR